MPADASLEATSRFTEKIESMLQAVPEVSVYASTVGEILGGFGTIPQRGPNVAQISVALGAARRQPARAPDGDVVVGFRSRAPDAVAEELRKRFQLLSGARIVVSKVRTFGVGQPIQIQLSGSDLAALAKAGEEMKSILARIPGVLDPDVSFRGGKPELAFLPNRLACAALDVPPSLAGQALRDAIEGKTVARARLGEAEVPVRSEVRDFEAPTPQALETLVVGFKGSRPVRLGELGRVERSKGPAAIDRVNGKRLVTVSANLAEGISLGDAKAAINRVMPDFGRRGIGVAWGGETAAMDENIPYFAFALGLAVLLVYLLMAALFNSLVKPLVVLASLPMALSGALGALVLAGESMSLVSMVGIMMLTGLMGRNAILLADYASTLHSRGFDMETAIVEAGATRLRPILMTTTATIAGMLPVALRFGEASELRAPMAIVVIGGLAVSTVVTLVVIPLLLSFGGYKTSSRGQAGR